LAEENPSFRGKNPLPKRKTRGENPFTKGKSLQRGENPFAKAKILRQGEKTPCAREKSSLGRLKTKKTPEAASISDQKSTSSKRKLKRKKSP
jgi:hypothetical protein